MMDRRDEATGPLACHESGFRDELLQLGYDRRRSGSHLDLLKDLSRWLKDQDLAPADLALPRVSEFLEVRRTRGHQDLVTLRGVAPLLGYLRALGVVPPPINPVPEGPVSAELERYRDYLASERGLAERGVIRYVAEVSSFVGSVTGPDGIDWAALSPADVTRFVMAACSGRRAIPSSSLLAALRSFLRFAQREGWTDLPLAQAVPSVARWGVASLPRRLEPHEVQQLLAGCDRGSAPGCRDFAILTLLVRLGLRAVEVARLQLRDIDWRAGNLVVCGKGRRTETLPLPTDVGAALAAYLRHARPRTKSRTVFLRLHAPLRGMTPIGVTSVVYRACDRAGLARVSAHHLRHSAATAMLRAGASLVEVGQALRHRSLNTTAIYAKIDHASLRTLARPWPGGAA